MSAFPPPAPTLAGDIESINRFMQQPAFVARRLQTLIDLRYVGTSILTGRQDTVGGAVGWEQVTSPFADRAPKAVAPGGEYPLTTIGTGPAALAKVTKWGEETYVADEDMARRRWNSVERALLFLANSVGQLIDSQVITAVYSAVTANANAQAKWDGTGSTPTILRDILKAKASIRALNLGYNPDALLVDDLAWANLASDTTIAAAMGREDRSNPIYTGRFEVLAGLEVIPVPTSNLPGGVGTNAFVIDRSRLGFIAKETLPSQGYVSAGDLVETKTWRPEKTDGWGVRARANFVPGISDPLAGFRIAGIA